MGYWPNSANFLNRVLHKNLVLISVRLPAIMADYCRGFPHYRQATARTLLSNQLRPFIILDTISKAKLIWTKTSSSSFTGVTTHCGFWSSQ